MNFSKYNGKGYTGLMNIGNTCFLNSCLQVLNHTYELKELIDSKNFNKQINDSKEESIILKEWAELSKTMWANNGIVSPNRFVYHVQEIARKKNKDIFTGWAQNDMSEFLLFIIECLHNSISRAMQMRITGTIETNTDNLAKECYNMLKKTYQREYSEIMNLYYAIYVSVITSIDGDTVHSFKPEMFFILDLPIYEPAKPESAVNSSTNNTSIYQCFDLFTHPELLEGENAWLNEKTNQKENIKKHITFWNFPKILVITLKRFSPCGQIKNQKNVEFPIDNLDLSKYVSGYNPSQYMYELFGVCNHIGNIYGGHYTAFVLNSKREWIHFNDSTVEVITDHSTIITPMAYCLFYRKKNNIL
jgi:ubiquitin carboxyl-terminal hydrolase 8